MVTCQRPLLKISDPTRGTLLDDKYIGWGQSGGVDIVELGPGDPVPAFLFEPQGVLYPAVLIPHEDGFPIPEVYNTHVF